MQKKFIKFEKCLKCYAKAWFCYQVWKVRVKEDLPCGPQFLVRTQRRIWGLTCGKNMFIEGRPEKTFLGRGESSQARHWHRNDEGGFRDKAFTYSFRQAWTDRCKLHNNRLRCLYLPHNSVCNNHCMYICVEYEPLMSSRLPQVI